MRSDFPLNILFYACDAEIDKTTFKTGRGERLIRGYTKSTSCMCSALGNPPLLVDPPLHSGIPPLPCTAGSPIPIVVHWGIPPGCTKSIHTRATIGEDGDITIPSPRRSSKQTLSGIRLHDPLHGRQACPDFNSFHQRVVQMCPR